MLVINEVSTTKLQTQSKLMYQQNKWAVNSQGHSPTGTEFASAPNSKPLPFQSWPGLTWRLRI